MPFKTNGSFGRAFLAPVGARHGVSDQQPEGREATACVRVSIRAPHEGAVGEATGGREAVTDSASAVISESSAVCL